MMSKNLQHLFFLMTATMLFASCGSTQYATYSPEETNLQSLTKITDNEDSRYFSPYGGDNGRNLFFTVSDKRGRSNIYRKDNPIAAAMSPKTDGNNINTSPTYCQATGQLAYAGRQEGAYVNDLYMMDAAQGSAIRRLTNTPSEIESYPCLSVDGSTIVYEKCYASGALKDAQIWRQDLRTESPTLLCQGRMPSLSHDGRTIVFVRFTPDGNNTCLVVMDANGQNQTELTDAKMGVVGVPRFSPDDRWIVFQCLKKDKKDYDLYVIRRDGTGLTQLTFNKSHDAEPYWSNDGYIYFSSDRGGRPNNYQIWRFKYGSAVPSYQPASQPVRSTTYQPAPQPQPTPAYVYHIVQDGETITDIARKYGITVRDVVKWNELTTMTIKPGMKLIVGNK